MTRSTFSTTTIASSTTTPIPSTSASSEIVLAEKPKASRNAKVPIRLTGIATIGMIVARTLPRNIKTTATTSTKAMTERLLHLVDRRGHEGTAVVEDLGLDV